MSEQKHEVTVYDRVPATASVSVAQVEAYLRRTGWTVWWSDEVRDLYHWRLNDDRMWTTKEQPERISETISTVAHFEHRQPSAVLADIAREHIA